jgi:8-oxo-dGTP pyrophosphatase MutT (NUDIX family)
MIQRKDSLGFMDIMRGKYKVNEPEYIKKQLRGMTEEERIKLETMDFEEIWHLLWGSDTESSKRYAHDRITSRQKLAELRAGVELVTGVRYTLSDLLRQEPVIYKTPEWGFPKGRRDPHELDIQCAFRELEEETGITEDEIMKVTNVSPLIEQFYGSNGVHYRHSYYIAQYIGHRSIDFDVLNTEMAREIGNLKWVNLDEANLLLRPENVEKHAILLKLSNLLTNFLPVFRTELYGVRMSANENTNGEQEYVFTSRVSAGNTAVPGNTAVAGNTTRFFGGRQNTRRIQHTD